MYPSSFGLRAAVCLSIYLVLINSTRKTSLTHATTQTFTRPRKQESTFPRSSRISNMVMALMRQNEESKRLHTQGGDTTTSTEQAKGMSESAKPDDTTSGKKSSAKNKAAEMEPSSCKPQEEMFMLHNKGGDVTATCPDGHFIIFNTVFVNCGKVDRDVTAQAWRKCANASTCILSGQDFEECGEGGKMRSISYMCSKVHGRDCALFPAFSRAKNTFCMHVCANYKRHCANSLEDDSDISTLECVWKLMKRNNLEHICYFLLDDTNPRSQQYNANSVAMQKFHIGRATIDTGTWTKIKFPQQIENPIVLCSLIKDNEAYSTVLIQAVTSEEFYAKLERVIWDGYNFTPDTTRRKTKVEWIAIAVGDHTFDDNRRIYAGLIATKADKPIKLPLDPSKEWSVVTSVQGSSVIKVGDGTASLGVPLVPHLTIEASNSVYVDFVYNIKKAREIPRVQLGYIAFQDGPGTIKFYDAKVRTFREPRQFAEHMTISMRLSDNWPRNIKLYATMKHLNTGNLSHVQNGIYTLNIIPTTSNRTAAEKVDNKREFKWDLVARGFASVVQPTSILISGFIIENISTISLKRVCNFVKKRRGYKRKSICFKECTSATGLRRCMSVDDVISCFNERSSNCELVSSPALLERIKNYKNILGLKSGSGEVNANAPGVGGDRQQLLDVDDEADTDSEDDLDGSKGVGAPDAVGRGKDASTPSDNQVDSGHDNLAPVVSGGSAENSTSGSSTTPLDSQVPTPHNNVGGGTSGAPVKPGAPNKPPPLKLPCIAGPWGEWSQCNRICTSAPGDGQRFRRRTIYAANTVEGIHHCATEESEICQNLPDCEKFCLVRQKDDGTQKHEYFIKWSPQCETMKVDFLFVENSIAATNDLAPTTLKPQDADEDDEEEGREDDQEEEEEEEEEKKGTSIKPLKMAELVDAQINRLATGTGDDKACDDSKVWSSCDAPCKRDGEDPMQYLLLPLQCNSTTRPCPLQLKPCQKPAEAAQKQQPRCILTNTIYDRVNKRWTKNGACNCARGVVCTAKEIYRDNAYTQDLRYEEGPRAHNYLRLYKVHEYVSLADRHRINIPSGHIKKITYGSFDDDKELENFCSTGSIGYKSYEPNLLHVNCDFARRRNKGTYNCTKKCHQIKSICDANIPRGDVADFVKCLNSKVANKDKSLDVLFYRHYKCKAPLDYIPGINNDPCESSTSMLQSEMVCGHFCNNILIECRNEHQHNREEKIRECMLQEIRDAEFRPDADAKDFNAMCKFKRFDLYGSGLVFCREDAIECTHDEWSQWSACNSDCLSQEEMPTRIRSRTLIIDQQTREYCESNYETQQIEGCSWLPPCATSEESTASAQKHIAWEIEVKQKRDLQAWVMEHSRMVNHDHMDSSEVAETTSVARRCTIYPGQRDVASTRFILQTSRCSCPASMHTCTMTESVNTPGWFDIVGLLCYQNEMRSIIFDQPNGFYRYSCLSKTFIKEDFDALKLLCNEESAGHTYVSCVGAASAHAFIMVWVATAAGILGGIFTMVYLVKHKALFHD